MKGMELLIGMFAMVITKLTSTEEETSSIPSHRWEAYPGNQQQVQRQILSNYEHCRKLQKGTRKKK